MVMAADDAGLDHVGFGDHVSFRTGAGADGLLGAAAVLAVSDRLAANTAVYLLPLRHPMPVARQLADLAALAPGRFVFGVGIGGEDPHEVETCGVDPRTRGRRMDEELQILRALLDGAVVDVEGAHFSLQGARIAPTPAVPIPIVVGGRSDAMQQFYGIPYERFQRWSPAGTPTEVADFLLPYVEAGCTLFNLILNGRSAEHEIEAASLIRDRILELGGGR